VRNGEPLARRYFFPGGLLYLERNRLYLEYYRLYFQRTTSILSVIISILSVPPLF
jgi:hypothetical protein